MRSSQRAPHPCSGCSAAAAALLLCPGLTLDGNEELQERPLIVSRHATGEHFYTHHGCVLYSLNLNLHIKLKLLLDKTSFGSYTRVADMLLLVIPC
jgi:hypothetical protein